MGMREREGEREYDEQRNKEVASGLSVGAPVKIYAFMLIQFKSLAITYCTSFSRILGLSRMTQNKIFI